MATVANNSSVESTVAEITELHWMMDMMQTIDIGLIVVDRSYTVKVWNSFMENHSGQCAVEAKNTSIFSLFPEIDPSWFKHKLEPAFLLKNRGFTTWEQRHYLCKFKNYRPITGTEPYMYQNITINPLVGVSGEVDNVAIIIYDVTDIAVNKNELKKANAELEILSRTDRLTGLNNRGYWEDCLTKEFNRYQRTKFPSSLIMFDIDHFKKVNDTYGHQAGDEVIRETSRVIKENLRDTDIAGRYGGEEFVIILIDTNAENTMYLAERLRKQIEALTVHTEGFDIKYTISIGISEVNEDILDHKTWLEQADQALYQCKHGGRNQTAIFSSKLH